MSNVVSVAIEIVFFSSVALVVYAYLGYPIIIFALSRMLGRPVRRSEITPAVSVIIAAHNEEKDIGAKIENTLSLDYPREKLEVVVASDCSSDRTDEIVRSYADRGVKLHRQPERLGKTVAQNEAVKVSSGEVLVFSDATTVYEHKALRNIVRGFGDPEVGCVAGRLEYVDSKTSCVGGGCRSYWSYEGFLRKCESHLGSLIGVSGCLYAVRRSSYSRMALDMSSDFVIALETRLQGLRTVFDEDAVAFEETNHRGRDEFRMRVRVIEQTLSALHRYRELLDYRKHGLFAFQAISHKALRYATAFFLLCAFVSNLLLIGESFGFLMLFSAQVVFYLAAAIGWCCDRIGVRAGPLMIPFYFALTNAASLLGFLKFMRGEAHLVWEPLREPADRRLPALDEAGASVQ